MYFEPESMDKELPNRPEPTFNPGGSHNMMRGKREGNWFSVDKSASEDDSNEEEQEDEESEEETEESEEEQEKHNIYVIALDNKLDYQRVTSNNMDPSTYTKIPGVLPQDVPEPILLNFKKGRLSEERRYALAGAFAAHIQVLSLIHI